ADENRQTFGRFRRRTHGEGGDLGSEWQLRWRRPGHSIVPGNVEATAIVREDITGARPGSQWNEAVHISLYPGRSSVARHQQRLRGLHAPVAVDPAPSPDRGRLTRIDDENVSARIGA